MPVPSRTCLRDAANGCVTAKDSLILDVLPKAILREIGFSAVALQNKSSTLSMSGAWPYEARLKKIWTGMPAH